MVGMSNANYALLGLTKGTPRKNIMKHFSEASYHPNKGGSTDAFPPYLEAFRRIRASLPPSQPVRPNNGRRTAAAGNITAFKAKVINNFFRTHKPMNLVPGPGNTTLAVVPSKVTGEPPKLIEAPAAVNEAVNAGKKLPAFVRHNTSYAGNGVGRKNNTKPPLPAQQPGKPSFWNRFKGVGRPSMPSFGFGGLFKSARQKAINAGNFIPRNTFNTPRNGYEFKRNKYGQGYYRLGSFYAKNPIKGLPAMGPVAMGFPVPSNGNKGPGNKGNNGPKNMITGNGGGGRGGGGSTRVRTGNVRTGNTRIGNVKSTSGSSRGEGGRGGSSRSEGGRGGSGGSISFAPVIKVNVPQAAAQSAVQALPAQERLALTNAGGYNNAAAAVSNAGGPATVERAIAALNANGGNVNAAMQKTGLPRQVFNNVNKLGGPVTARRTLTAVKKVTMKTAPYVGQNATRRVAQNVYMGPNATRQNVYTLAPVKKPRKKRMEVQLAELNRVINAVKKKKLTSLVAHNVTKTNIHANENRLKSYYKRVIKAAILKRPFAKIARGHAKKLVSSTRAKKPRRKTTPTNYPTYV